MSAIHFQRLSPERQSPSTNAASAGGACCCCCCCLHTVGGLIGAASAGPPVKNSSGPENESAVSLSARKPYWLSVLASCLLILMFYPVITDEPFETGLFLLAIFGPGVQLVASVFAAVGIQSGEKAGRKPKLWHLGKITLFSLLGGAVGFGILMMLAQN